GSHFLPITINSPLLNELKRNLQFLHWKAENCPPLSYPFPDILNSIISVDEDTYVPEIVFHTNFQQLLTTILLLLRNIILKYKNFNKSSIKLFFNMPNVPFLLKLLKTYAFEYTSEPNDCDVEIISTPSIVTGHLNTRQSLPAAYRYVIYDCRTYWPLYTRENNLFSDVLIQNSIFLYSFDYLLGTRSHPLSWALIENKHIADIYNQNIIEQEWTIDLNTISIIRSMLTYLL